MMMGVESKSDKEKVEENTVLRKNKKMVESMNSRFQ